MHSIQPTDEPWRNLKWWPRKQAASRCNSMGNHASSFPVQSVASNVLSSTPLGWVDHDDASPQEHEHEQINVDEQQHYLVKQSSMPLAQKTVSREFSGMCHSQHEQEHEAVPATSTQPQHNMHSNQSSRDTPANLFPTHSEMETFNPLFFLSNLKENPCSPPREGATRDTQTNKNNTTQQSSDLSRSLRQDNLCAIAGPVETEEDSHKEEEEEQQQSIPKTTSTTIATRPKTQDKSQTTIPPPPHLSIPSFRQGLHESIGKEFYKGLSQIQAKNRKGKACVDFTLHCAPATATSQLLPFLETCQAFQDAGKELEISLGYHYTNSEYLASIRQYGLLTRQERRALGIQVRANGSTHGDGIYMSSNPFAFRDFRRHASTALLVLRVSGSTLKHSSASPLLAKALIDELDNVDTLTEQRGIGKDLVVLKGSKQCVVLGEFSSSLLDRSVSAERILVLQGKIQRLVEQIVRKKFRHTEVEMLKKDVPGAACQHEIAQYFPSQTRYTDLVFSDGAKTLKRTSCSEKVNRTGLRVAYLRYGAPRTLVASMKEYAHKMEPHQPARFDECSICFEAMYGKSDLVSLKGCGHGFHKECLRQALQFDSKCPLCRKVTSEPKGKMPSGKMVIVLDEKLACEGYDPGTWRIRYSMKAGTQKAYHDQPGETFSATKRDAFIPNTEKGRRLLKRLTYAYSRGLTFTIGTSLTTGHGNRIVWASIHHKTRPGKGQYGYPDPSYFLNCNEELDALGVPSHDDPSLHIVFATRCMTSVNFGYLFADENDYLGHIS